MPQSICYILSVQKTKGLQCRFLENFSGIAATFVASGSCESGTFYWCLFWVLEAVGKAGRQLESYENGSTKLHFSYTFPSVLCPSLFTRASSSHAETDIAMGPDHMSVFVSNRIRARVKHYEMSCSYICITSLCCKHLLSPQLSHNSLNHLLWVLALSKLFHLDFSLVFLSFTVTRRTFLRSNAAHKSSPFVSWNNS